MSTVKLAERVTTNASEVPGGGWVEVVTPTNAMPQPGAPGVVLSIAAARARFARGETADIVVEESDSVEDDETSAEMAEYFDSTWDA